MSEQLIEDGMDLGSLDFQKITVTIDGKKYVVSEASGEAAIAFKNGMASGTKFQDGKVAGIGRIANSEYTLLDLCLRTHNGQPVGSKKLLTWPERILRPLIKWVREVSELNDDETEESEGNSETGQTDTTDGLESNESSDSPATSKKSRKK